MLNIHFGRESLDKEKYIFDSIDLKEKILILVPDQFTLGFERDLFEHFKAKAMMNVEVTSMSGLGQRLIGELGGASRSFIDKYGRHMLLSKVLREEKQNLSVYRGMEGKNSFLELLNNFISELKQYNVSPEKLLESEESDLNEVMRAKLSDLAHIYKKYNEKIEGKYTDSEDLIDLYVNKISRSERVKASKIWIYGFDSFAPKAMSVIGELIGRAKEVNIVMTASGSKTDNDAELFALSNYVMKSLESEAKARGIEARRIEIPYSYEFKTKCFASKEIEKSLYAFPAGKVEGDAENSLVLVKARNVYQEAENAAGFVLKLLREKKYELSDIKLISNDNQKRIPITKRIFSEYGLNLFSDEARDIRENSAVAASLSVLDVLNSRYRTSDVICMLKLGFSDLNSHEIDLLENYANLFRIENEKWLSDFTKVGQNKKGRINLTELNEYRRRAIEPIERLGKSLIKLKTNSEFVKCYIDFLENDIKIPEKLKEMPESDVSKQAFEAFENILSQIKEIAGEEDFVLSDITKLIEVGTRQVKIGVLPPTGDDLTIGNIQRTRIGKVKALIVLGANENVLPMEASSTGIFSGDERSELESKGLGILKTDLVMLEEERMAIYRNLVKPSEVLYVSYSSTGPGGESTNPSNLFLKLKSIFPDVKVREDSVSLGDDKLLVGANVSGLRHLCEALHKANDGGELTSDWDSALSWYKEKDGESISVLRRGLGFDILDKQLGRDVADALYKKDVKEALSLSASMLEEFSKCPFKHFIDYGLNPDEDEEFRVQATDIGIVCHNTFEKLTGSLSEDGTVLNLENGKIENITKEDIKNFADEKFDDMSTEYKDGIFGYTAEDEYRKSRVKTLAEKASWAIVRQIQEGKITAVKNEVAFGRGKKIKPIVLNIDGEKVYIEGRVDRVDYLPNDRVKIIDYKTGENTIAPYEATEGFKLQLMLYLKAAKEEKYKPAGVFYFNADAKNETVKTTEDTDDFAAKNALKAYQLSGIVVNDEEVIKSIAGDFNGYSEILAVSRSKENKISERGASKRLLTDDEFSNLEKIFDGKIDNIARRLRYGDISIRPLRNDKKTPCEYCAYKGICRFDLKYPECKFVDIKKEVDLSEDQSKWNE